MRKRALNFCGSSKLSFRQAGTFRASAEGGRRWEDQLHLEAWVEDYVRSWKVLHCNTMKIGRFPAFAVEQTNPGIFMILWGHLVRHIGICSTWPLLDLTFSREPAGSGLNFEKLARSGRV